MAEIVAGSPTPQPTPQRCPSPTHLVVVAHGLHGSPASCVSIKTAILEAHPGVLVHLSACSETTLTRLWATTDGVDAGGDRLAREIRDLLRAHTSVSLLSLVGISLGGLYTRAALRYIADLPLGLVNYITFATPHVGVRDHLGFVIETAVRWGIVGLTGAELLLADAPIVREGCGDEPLPFLAWMAHPASPHAQVLKRFAHRTLVANVESDDKVPHWSAALFCGGAPVLAALASQDPSGYRREPPLGQALPGDFPHVASVFRLPSPATETSTSTREAEGVAPASSDAAAGSEGSIESTLVAQLRSIGEWTNVEVLFQEPGAFILNHMRVADARPWLTSVGSDVPRFVARHHFGVGTA